MAHMIDSSNNRSNIAFVGETPWHGLGQQLTAGAAIEVWLREAGLNWNALLSLVQYRDIEGNLQQDDSNAVIYRDDTKKPLGLVGKGFKVVQPTEVLELFRDLTEQYGYQLETAGSLKGGRIVWALAKGVDSAIIGDRSVGDIVNDYLLCSTAFDGSAATVTRRTPIRVVCKNTYTLAEAAAGGHRVSHRSVWDANDAKKSLSVGAFARMEDTANLLANKKVEPAQQVGFLLQAYHGLTVAQAHEATQAAAKGDKKALTVANGVTETLERLSGILTGAPGQQLATAKDTAWGLFNAVTYDVDHVKAARSQENRLNSAWFGAGDKLKSKAYAMAVDTLDGSDLLGSLLRKAA